MENLRPILWIAAVVLLWACVLVWQKDHAPLVPATPDAAAAATAATATSGGVTPPAGTPAQALGVAGGNGAAPAEAVPAPVRLPPIHVRTDVLDVQIDPLGGDLNLARLPAYPVRKDQPDVPVALLGPEPDARFVFHSGLRAAAPLPQLDRTTVYQSEGTDYRLDSGASELPVTLRWEGPDGLTVEKVYRFRRGQYDIGLEYRVHNGTGAPWQAANFLQIERRHAPPERSYFNVDSYSFTGPVAYDGQKYSKIKLDKLQSDPFHQSVANGWIASIQHHFLAAAVPPPASTWNYDIAWDGRIYTLNAVGPVIDVAPGTDAVFASQLFVGPKLQVQLAKAAPGLPLVADYGYLSILAQPLFWLLEKIHAFVGNWGWSIIFATFLIKLAFYKLTEASGRSMAKMRKIQPRLKALQDRFADDRQALSQALMELYKKEKVNPAAGCLPMVIQIPFFIAYYWVLLESVEMRQAPFALWITDLSSRDPYFVLPLLMGVAMFVQQSLNPAPPDPVQAKLMKVMPVMFTGFFAFFPAGLVLYWLTNSVLSILQQWRINKVLAVD